MVHSGEHHGGHYVAYIDPQCNSRWFKFDDDIVSPVSQKEAIQANYGGDPIDDSIMSMMQKANTNAYMLIYVRETEIKELVVGKELSVIPESVVSRVKHEMAIEEVRQKEKEDSLLYQQVNIITEDCFHHAKEDLIDVDNVNLK